MKRNEYFFFPDKDNPNSDLASNNTSLTDSKH